jgi:hypothetical protein
MEPERGHTTGLTQPRLKSSSSSIWSVNLYEGVVHPSLSFAQVKLASRKPMSVDASAVMSAAVSSFSANESNSSVYTTNQSSTTVGRDARTLCKKSLIRSIETFASTNWTMRKVAIESWTRKVSNMGMVLNTIDGRSSCFMRTVYGSDS